LPVLRVKCENLISFEKSPDHFRCNNRPVHYARHHSSETYVTNRVNIHVVWSKCTNNTYHTRMRIGISYRFIIIIACCRILVSKRFTIRGIRSRMVRYNNIIHNIGIKCHTHMMLYVCNSVYIYIYLGISVLRYFLFFFLSHGIYTIFRCVFASKETHKNVVILQGRVTEISISLGQ